MVDSLHSCIKYHFALYSSKDTTCYSILPSNTATYIVIKKILQARVLDRDSYDMCSGSALLFNWPTCDLLWFSGLQVLCSYQSHSQFYRCCGRPAFRQCTSFAFILSEQCLSSFDHLRLLQPRLVELQDRTSSSYAM